LNVAESESRNKERRSVPIDAENRKGVTWLKQDEMAETSLALTSSLALKVSDKITGKTAFAKKSSNNGEVRSFSPQYSSTRKKHNGDNGPASRRRNAPIQASIARGYRKAVSIKRVWGASDGVKQEV
jgi:hypothetical protein